MAVPIEHCLNCNRPETETPLVTLRMAGRSLWICPQCLPILIHHPEQLTDKLEQATRIVPPGERQKRT